MQIQFVCFILDSVLRLFVTRSQIDFESLRPERLMSYPGSTSSIFMSDRWRSYVGYVGYVGPTSANESRHRTNVGWRQLSPARPQRSWLTYTPCYCSFAVSKANVWPGNLFISFTSAIRHRNTGYTHVALRLNISSTVFFFDLDTSSTVFFFKFSLSSNCYHHAI